MRTKLGVWASSAVLAILATTLSANASCKLKGNWFMYNVRLNANGTDSVNKCTLTLDAGGATTGQCTGYADGGLLASASNSAGPASGNITADALCNLSGAITVTFPNNTTSTVNITAGHMNGSMATGISINDDGTNITAVRLFTLIQQ